MQQQCNITNIKINQPTASQEPPLKKKKYREVVKRLKILQNYITILT